MSADHVTARVRCALSQVTVSEGGCWIPAQVPNSHGYVRIGLTSGHSRPRSFVALHRASFELHTGRPIPEGMEIDHLCRNKACCNPDHLEAVTHYENVMRGTSPSARRAGATHCDRGHEFTAQNTYLRPDGYRTCRACTAQSRNSRRAAS